MSQSNTPGDPQTIHPRVFFSVRTMCIALLYEYMYACACPTLIPSNEYMYACACPTLIPTIGGGHPPSIIMGARRRNLRLARGSADSGCLLTHLCLYHALPRPHPASHPHNTLACNYSSLPPLSVLPPPHTHTFQHIIFCKYIGPRLCVRFFVKGARSMGLLHIHTTHFINTRKHPTPKRLDKVYKGESLGCTPLFPSTKTVRLWDVYRYRTGCISLVSLFNPLFKRSRLHCFDICLM